MGNKHNDINDKEIRIISSNTDTGSSTSGRWYTRSTVWMSIAACIIIAGVFLYGFLKSGNCSSNENLLVSVKGSDSKTTSANSKADSTPIKAGYVEITDTTINNIPLSIFTPRCAVAKLQIGNEALNDTNAVFVVQAADVRKDNGQIVGTYVSEGNLISKGQSKSGFCAIIGGAPIVGVSDATPYFEQAIETNGYFFRQYPLVVGGQVVENKPKGKSLRKALAERKGEIVVVMSKSDLTFHEFARALLDIEVSNAIYLVGSSSFGFAVDPVGRRVEFGQRAASYPTNTNYLIWR